MKMDFKNFVKGNAFLQWEQVSGRIYTGKEWTFLHHIVLL